MKFSGDQIRKVVLEKKTTTTNEYNEQIEAWNPATSISPNGEIFAEKWDQGGKEALESGQIVAMKDVRFRIRYVDGLNENEYRINYDGKIYDIENIKEIGRREGQVLITRQRDNQ